jgi:hypothetical protein
MKTRHSKKWLPWIGTQGWFDGKTGKLHLTFAKVLKADSHQPYPYVVGEEQKFLLVSFDMRAISRFPKKYVVLPKP